METESSDTKNNIIGIIGAGVFFCCTVLIPLQRIIGGFLWMRRRQFHWDKIIGSERTFKYARFGRNSDIKIIWEIIPQWGYIWIGLSLLGAVLISIPPLLQLLKKNPIILEKIPLSLIGLITGLFATIVELGLFFIIRSFHDWGRPANLPIFNVFMFIYFFIGWVALFIGYRYPIKSIVSGDYSATPIAPEITLKAEEIHKYFGGVKALEGATVGVKRNRMIALIGPNGCGKTTLFNVITGWLAKTNPSVFEDEIEIEVKESLRAFFVRIFRTILEKVTRRKMVDVDILPDVGNVVFEDMRVDGFSAHETALTGMMRTFQTTRNWPNLTVLENLLVAPHEQTGESLWKLFLRRRKIKEDERKNTLKALEVLEFLEIIHIRDQIAQELSGGQLKLLALGRLLMTVPRLFLLDEPMAGINPTLGNIIMDKIAELTEAATVFLIEHNMDVVFNYSDDIFVMASGKIIAQGEPAAIEQNRDVIEAYLGKDY